MRSYAHLEHGRFYTGLPVYYVSKGTGEGKGEYTIGASVVWEIGAGENAGIIEFNGNGLKFLENAIATKEAHISTLGGRLIGVTTSSVSESDNQVSMKDRNEQALLLNVSMALDEGFTQVLQWWASWQDVQTSEAEEISIEFNKDLMLKEAAARESAPSSRCTKTEFCRSKWSTTISRRRRSFRTGLSWKSSRSCSRLRTAFRTIRMRKPTLEALRGERPKEPGADCREPGGACLGRRDPRNLLAPEFRDVRIVGKEHIAPRRADLRHRRSLRTLH
ncbi:DUF4055 domain-containing protein [Sinorhizobium medicae]|uniref:DUF4055 domain-containing protein n=1 Tax=Sinorhizobium medicae TaxID=110321 RepID=UPI00396A333F